MEKTPEEIGKLFEIINNKINDRLVALPPLKLKLESTYKAYHKEMLDNIDKEKLIVLLDALEEPVSFVQYRELAQEKLEKELESLKQQRRKLEDRCNIEIEAEMLLTKENVRLLPLKIPALLDRYNILEEILSADGFVTKTFNELEKRNNSFRVRQFKNELWKKSMSVTVQFATLVYELQIAWKNIWMLNSDIEINKHIGEFDVLLMKLEKFIDIDNILEGTMTLIDVTSSQIQQLYTRIKEQNSEIDIIARTISSGDEIQKMVRNEKSHLIKLSNEQKRLRLDILDLDVPIGQTQTILDSKSYVLEVFWKFIEYEYDGFNDDVKNILNFNNYQNWFDARKKYELLLKTEQVLNANQMMFKSLMEAFDRSMANLKQAKRNYGRYQDSSSKIALDKCTMHPVNISEQDNTHIAKLYVLCSNLENIATYIDNTNLFYDKNIDLVISMYENVKMAMEMWTNMFAKLIGK